MGIWRKTQKDSQAPPADKEGKETTSKNAQPDDKGFRGESTSFVAKTTVEQVNETDGALKDVPVIKNIPSDSAPSSNDTCSQPVYAPASPASESPPSVYVPPTVPSASEPTLPYENEEVYYANSATQSYLHDNYYPHVYHGDWYDTAYDETDRANDFYQEDAYRTADEYWQDYYRDQEAAQRNWDDSYGTSRPSSSSFAAPFAGAAAVAAGVLASHEAYEPDSWMPHAETPPITSQPFVDRNESDVRFPSSEDGSRLTVNRSEPNPVSDPYSSAEYRAERLLVHQEAEQYAPTDGSPRLTVNRAGEFPDSSTERLTVNRPEENLPTSEYLPTSVDSLFAGTASSPLEETRNAQTMPTSIPLTPSEWSQPAWSDAQWQPTEWNTSDRLMVNRPEEYLASDLDRLTVNRSEENLPTSAYPQNAAPPDPFLPAQLFEVSDPSALSGDENRLTINQWDDVSQSNMDRLTVNRPEAEVPSSAERLTVNQPLTEIPGFPLPTETSEQVWDSWMTTNHPATPTGEHAVPLPAVSNEWESAERLTVNRPEEYLASNLDRLTVNQPEQNLPTSAAAVSIPQETPMPGYPAGVIAAEPAADTLFTTYETAGEHRESSHRLTVNRSEEILPTSEYLQAGLQPDPFLSGLSFEGTVHSDLLNDPDPSMMNQQKATYEPIMTHMPAERLTVNRWDDVAYSNADRLTVNQSEEEALSSVERLTVNRSEEVMVSPAERLTVNQPLADSPGFPLPADTLDPQQAAAILENQTSSSAMPESSMLPIAAENGEAERLAVNREGNVPLNTPFIDNPEAAADRLMVNRVEEGDRKEDILASSEDRLTVNQPLEAQQLIEDLSENAGALNEMSAQAGVVAGMEAAASASVSQMTPERLEKILPVFPPKPKTNEARVEPQEQTATVVSAPESAAERLTVNQLEAEQLSVAEDNLNRLTVNRSEENLPTSETPFVTTADSEAERANLLFGQENEAERLTINQLEEERLAVAVENENRLMVNQAEADSATDPNRLTVNRFEEYLPTSEAPFLAPKETASIEESLFSSQETEAERLIVNQSDEEALSSVERLMVNRSTLAEHQNDTKEEQLKEGSLLSSEKQMKDDEVLPTDPQPEGLVSNHLDWEALLLEAQQKANQSILDEDQLRTSSILSKETKENRTPRMGKAPLFVGYSQAVDEDQVTQAATFLVEPPTAEEKTRHVILDPDAQAQEKKQQTKDSLLPDEKEQLTIEGTLNDSLLTEGETNPAIPSSRSTKAKHHLKEAGAASLGVLGGLGRLTEKAVVGTGKTITAMASRAVQEDETFAPMDETRKTVVQSATKAWAHNRAIRNRDFIRERFVAKHITPLVKKDKTSHLPAGTRVSGVPGVYTPTHAVDARQLEERLREKKSLTQTKNVLKEEVSPENGPVLSENKGLLSKQTADKKKQVVFAADKKEEASQLLLGKKEEKEPGKKNRPVTKRERERASKAKALKESGTELDGVLPAGAMLSTINTAKRGALLGAETTLNMGGASLRKMVTKDNEQMAMLFTIKDRSMQAIGAVKTLARAPRRIAQATMSVARFIRNIARAIWHAVAAIGTSCWPVLLLLLALLLVVVIFLIGSLSIINDNQETSEVAALVAKLDGDLEKKIHSYGGGNAAVYYCDARGSYYQENKDGELDFYDVDMRNEACELKTVNASSVKVYTNPEDIAAYIDAKYDGEWQVGAASWKMTVEFKGKTWTIIDWQHVPEFFTKGIKKIEKTKFEYESIGMIENYLREEYPDMDEIAAYDTAVAVTAELSNVIYDQDLQGVNDEVIYEAVRVGVKKHKSDLELSADQLKELNYRLMEKLTFLVGEQDPTALVYDEIVDLHTYLNWWSEDYTHIDAASTGGMGSGTGSAGSSGMGGTNNSSGFPNASGYDEAELAKWEGYNEVSLYGISESGTTSITGDGTHITNDWSDTNMAIACEGDQMALYAYWTGPYKDLHEDSSQPVRVTMYNPSTGKTVTAEVRDVGGWRGYNDRYEGMNPTRQWDLLPAVWLALGGTQSSGLMNVYWKVDNAAPITGGDGSSGSGGAGAAGAPVEIEGYPWAAETDKGDSIISVNRATYIRHEMADLLGNEQTFSAILGPDNYGSYAEFLAVREWLSSKLRFIMKPLLTDQNSNGDTYTDYFLSRRELGNPFGTYDGGQPVQWVVTERFNPGFEDSFDLDKAYAEIKPLSGGGSVYAVREGTVDEVGDGSVTITYKIDEQTEELMVYSNLSSIKVKAGDEVKEGTHLGNLSSGKELRIAWYEKFMIDMGGFKRKWAYCPTMFMAGFAGVVEPDQPTEYTGSGAGARDLKDCTTIVDFAYSRLGCPYVWNTAGPDTFDCSGLTQWCYKQAGISIPRNSEAQHAGGTIIPLDESKMQPGDILWKPGHVGIYIGEGKCIHAPTTGDVVKISTISWWTEAVRYT